jgi:Rod binding domain-containing protein
MAGIASLSVPGMSPIDVLNAKKPALANLSSTSGTTSASGVSDAAKAKAKTTSQDFEAVFLNSMFQQMFTGIQGDGPFGGNGATGVWRSFLTDEYAKSFAKSGGIGIADQVYKSLIAHQEARA